MVIESPETKAIEEKLKIESQQKNGAYWFFWIAGLSLINSIIFLSGNQWNFLIGLGITQMIDGIGMELAGDMGSITKIIVLILDIIAAGIFVIFGVLSRKQYGWAFIVGMILYAIDGLLFLLVQDFLSIGFHIFALIGIYSGYNANKKLKTIDVKTIEGGITPPPKN